MIGKLAGLAGRLRRPRNFALAVVLGLGVVAVPAVAFAPPALALNCTYDAFYAFQSDWTQHYAWNDGISNGYGDVVRDAANYDTSFCQLSTGYSSDGYAWYEWVQQGTSNCLTLNSTDGEIDMTSCNTTGSTPSQQWALTDPLAGTENWGEVLNGFRDYLLTDEGSTQNLGWQPPNLSIGLPQEWQLIYTGT